VSLSLLPSFTLLLAVAYAPWHGALFLGKRTPVGINLPVLERLTWPGLCNVVLIAASTAALIALAIKTRPKLSAFSTWGPFLPLLLGLAMLREIDHLSLVSIQNLGLLSLLTYVIAHRHRCYDELQPLKVAPLVLISSLSAAMILPRLFQREGADIYWSFFAVERFTGWTGEGTPLAFAGTLVLLGSLSGLLKLRSNTRGTNSLFLIGAALGAYTIAVTVHRGSLLALFTGLFVALFFSNQIQARFKIATSAALLLLGIAVATQSSSFRLKNSLVFDKRSDNTVNYEVRAKTTFLDRIINTNGRAEAFDRLNFEMDTPFKVMLGNGTGFAPRLLRYIEFNSPEPGSDLTRIWIEFGLLGFLVFGTWGAILFRSLKKHALSLGYLGVGAAYMLTENVLVTPSFGYFPILLFALYASLDAQNSTASAKSSSVNLTPV
jgi:hypothetical protein